MLRSTSFLLARRCELLSKSFTRHCHPVPNNTSNLQENLFTTERIPEQDWEQHQLVMQFIRDSFYPPESLRKVSIFNSSKVFNWMNFTVLPNLLKQGVSIKIHDHNNNVIGVAVNQIIESESERNNQWMPLFGKKMWMANTCLCLKRPQENCDCHEKKDDAAEYRFRGPMNIFYLAVHERHRGIGLGRSLIGKSVELAREDKRRYINSFSSGDALLHLFDQLEFETVNELQLSEYYVDGVQLFPNAGPSDVLRAVVKDL